MQYDNDPTLPIRYRHSEHDGHVLVIWMFDNSEEQVDLFMQAITNTTAFDWLLEYHKEDAELLTYFTERIELFQQTIADATFLRFARVK